MRNGRVKALEIDLGVFGIRTGIQRSFQGVDDSLGECEFGRGENI